MQNTTYPTNKDSMVTVKENFGYNQKASYCTVIDEPMKSKECIEKAGLNWEVKPQEVFTINRKRNCYQEVPKHQAIVRQDNQETLSIMGSRYQIIQNDEAFDFFDGVIDSGQAYYTSAGSLNGGRRVFIFAKLNSSMFIDEGDEVARNIMLHTSHDGNSLVLRQVAEQVNCTNQFSFFLGSSFNSNSIKIRHVGNFKQKKLDAQKALKLSVGYFDDLQGVLKGLKNVDMSKKEMVEFTERLIPDNEEAKSNKRKENQREDIQDLFSERLGRNFRGYNRYSALNAVTEYTTHHSRVSKNKRNIVDEKRFESNHFGTGSRLSQRAFELLVETSLVG